MAFVEPVTLRGSYATVEPLAVGHADDLRRAASDGELWRLWYTSVATPEKMDEFRAWVAGCKTKRELQDGMRPWQEFVRIHASEPIYDVRFNKGGKLAAEMSNLYATRKGEVPA